MTSSKYTNNEILEGIINRNEKIAKYLYDKIFPAVYKHISLNNGNKEDAFDVFEKAYLIVEKKIRNDELVLSCKFSTYFFSVCRNVWFNELRKMKKEILDHDVIFEYRTSDTLNYIERLIEYEPYYLYKKHFERLSELCKKLLSMALEKIPYERIAAKLNYSSAGMARKRKYKCKKKLLESIRKDPLFTELNNS